MNISIAKFSKVIFGLFDRAIAKIVAPSVFDYKLDRGSARRSALLLAKYEKRDKDHTADIEQLIVQKQALLEILQRIPGLKSNEAIIKNARIKLAAALQREYRYQNEIDRLQRENNNFKAQIARTAKGQVLALMGQLEATQKALTEITKKYEDLSIAVAADTGEQSPDCGVERENGWKEIIDY